MATSSRATAAAKDCGTLEGCGNGRMESGEECDDDNEIAGDGCSADCQRIETCGNGMREFGEVCDDGNMVSGDGCSPDCISIEICGNGYRARACRSFIVVGWRQAAA